MQLDLNEHFEFGIWTENSALYIWTCTIVWILCCKYLMWTINLCQLNLDWTYIQCNRNLGKLKDSTYSFTLMLWQLLHLNSNLIYTLDRHSSDWKLYWFYLRGPHITKNTYYHPSVSPTFEKMWPDPRNKGPWEGLPSNKEPIFYQNNTSTDLENLEKMPIQHARTAIMSVINWVTGFREFGKSSSFSTFTTIQTGILWIKSFFGNK